MDIYHYVQLDIFVNKKGMIKVVNGLLVLKVAKKIKMKIKGQNERVYDFSYRSGDKPYLTVTYVLMSLFNKRQKWRFSFLKEKNVKKICIKVKILDVAVV